jgi:cytoskeletal protein RodZ
MTAPKPEWFEMSENNTPATGIRKIDKKLPLAAIISAGVVILAGSLFANANDEPAAVADTQQNVQSTVSNTPLPKNVASSVQTQNKSTTTSTQTKSTPPAPKINNVPQSQVKNSERGEHEGRERGEHEGRERGEHEGGQERDDD